MTTQRLQRDSIASIDATNVYHEHEHDTTLVKHHETQSATALGTGWQAKSRAAQELRDAVALTHNDRVVDAKVLVIDDVTPRSCSSTPSRASFGPMTPNTSTDW